MTTTTTIQATETETETRYYAAWWPEQAAIEAVATSEDDVRGMIIAIGGDDMDYDALEVWECDRALYEEVQAHGGCVDWQVSLGDGIARLR